jgi:hypothetical protein
VRGIAALMEIRALHTPGGRGSHRAGQGLADAFRDFARMRFQGEVAGVEETNDRAGVVALERLGAGRQAAVITRRSIPPGEGEDAGRRSLAGLEQDHYRISMTSTSCLSSMIPITCANGCCT